MLLIITERTDSTYTSLLAVYFRTDNASGAIHLIGSRPCSLQQQYFYNNTANLLSLNHLRHSNINVDDLEQP